MLGYGHILTPPRFNLLGQVAVTTGITFGLANLISTTATVGTGYKPTAGATLGIYAALLVSHGIINSFGVRILRYLNDTSIVLHSVGISCFCIAVLAKAPTHQSAKFVFSTFYDGTGEEGMGWSVRASPAYVAACGVLMSQYTITGRPLHSLAAPFAQLLQALTRLPIYPRKHATLNGAPRLVCSCQ